MGRPKRPNRMYLRNGRWHANFSDLGGGREALKPPGTKRATKDELIAIELCARRTKELEQKSRYKIIHGIEGPALLGPYAQHHLVEKAKAGNCTLEWIARAEDKLTDAVAFFGTDRELTTITVRDVQRFQAWVQEGGKGRRGNAMRSPGTVRHYLNALSNLYRRAASEGFVQPGYNPVTAMMDKPVGKPAEARWLEVPDAALLLESARTYQPSDSAGALPFMYPLVATFLLTGGRKSEVLGLQLSDVSFERRAITFRVNEWRRLKTMTSARTIPMWPQLESILRTYLAERSEVGHALLFPSARSGRMIVELRSQLDSIAERAGWKEGDVRTKMFRHTYCSARLQTLDHGAPVSPYTVAKELGHGGMSLVNRVYGHLGTVRHRSEFVEYRVEQHENALRSRVAALKLVS